MKICIVISDYYKDISENLSKGCIQELKKNGYKNLNIKWPTNSPKLSKKDKNNISFKNL